MKKLNKYIFKQIFISFLLSVLSLMAIIWLTQSLRFLDFITDKGIGVLTFVEITSLLMPRIFSVISPIAVFASTLFVYNKMLNDRELVVIKAAGITPFEMIKPAIVFGFLLMIFNVFVYNYGIGASEKKFNELQWQIKNNISGVVLKSGEFNFLSNGLMVFVSKQNKDGSVEGVLINDEKNPKVKKTIFAEYGRIVYNNNKPRIILINGISQEVGTKKNDFKATGFNRYSVDMGVSEVSNKKKDGVRTKGFKELWAAVDDKTLSKEEKASQFAEANKRVLAPIYNVLFALIGCIGLVVGGFNRRGQGKILTISMLAMVLIQALDLVVFSKASDNINYVVFMYFVLMLPILVCVFFFKFYKPKKIQKMAAVISCLMLLFVVDAKAQVAGEVLDLVEKAPYVEIAPTKNLTNFMSEQQSEKDEIDFSADEIEYYKDLSTVVAVGNVEIVKDGMSVYANKVIYNQKTDEIAASGNVIMVEENGNVVFSEYAELTSKLTRAEMEKVLVIMQDKTRLSAQKVTKDADNTKILTKATYSPCDVCKGGDPLWQLKASEVKHDEKTQDIYYKNARLEVSGVPIFYMPYFSHPDPNVKRRSGFLNPGLESNSYYGAGINIPFFWAIDDNEDLLFNPTFTSDKGVIFDATYKKYYNNAYFEIEGSFLKDDDLDEVRGVLYSKFDYEINDMWRFRSDINYVSDRTYLKDLSLDNENDPWLTSEFAFEGFNNRNYSSVSAYYYKTLSYQLQNTSQPFVLPLFDYEVYSDVSSIGSYSKLEFNAASVNRDNHDTSTQRFTLLNSWQLPFTSRYGEQYKLQASLKSDLYYVSDYYNSIIHNDEYNGVVGRVFPQLGMEWRMPFIKSGQNRRHVLEPVIVGVVAPNGGQETDKIPNEDSLDVRIDDTNILSLDRYAGYDRNDVGSRVSYGLNWNTYNEKGGRSAVFLAQTYNINENNDFLAEDKDGHFSDYVGRVYAQPNENINFDYRFRLDKETLSLKYSELGTTFGPSMLKIYLSYIFLDDDIALSNALFGYDTREELYASIKAQLSRDWALVLYNRLDLETTSNTSLEHGGELIYENECVSVSGYVRKENSIDPEVENDFEFGMNFLLKTLGGVGSK